jgi:hypothetical protein
MDTSGNKIWIRGLKRLWLDVTWADRKLRHRTPAGLSTEPVISGTQSSLHPRDGSSALSSKENRNPYHKQMSVTILNRKKEHRPQQGCGEVTNE